MTKVMYMLQYQYICISIEATLEDDQIYMEYLDIRFRYGFGYYLYYYDIEMKY